MARFPSTSVQHSDHRQELLWSIATLLLGAAVLAVLWSQRRAFKVAALPRSLTPPLRPDWSNLGPTSPLADLARRDEAAAPSDEERTKSGHNEEHPVGWVDGDGSQECPEGYPVKGNARSRIYHLPGESSYARTRAEICFATAVEAAAMGYRPRQR